VTPRISPDGLVVMEIDAEKSQLGTEEEGIPVTISATGEVVRSPRIKITLAQTTVSALSGQTVVLGGLITKGKTDVHRKVPGLGDIPLLGHLFRFDSLITKRTELLIIMTPHIVKTEEDAELIKQTESARMSWCLSDVLELQGDDGFRTRSDDWSDAETTVIYPDLNPDGKITPIPEDAVEGEELPTAPQGNPFRREMVPDPGSQPERPTLAPPAPNGEVPAMPELPMDPQAAAALQGDALMRLRVAQQAGYRPAPSLGGVEQAVYQRRDVRSAAVPPVYYVYPPYQSLPSVTPAPYQSPPAAPPAMYGRPPVTQPVIQPVQYQQPPAAQPPPGQTPMARMPQSSTPWLR